MAEPPEVRASDAEREHAVERLRAAAGDGRLTVDELSDRTDAAYRAATRGELERLIADLPAADEPARAAPAQPPAPAPPARERIVGVLGGSDVEGRMRIAERMSVVSVLGGHNVDLSDAVFDGPEVEINVVSILGGSDFWVPEGVEVVHDVTSILGGDTVKPAESPPPPGAPVVRFTGLSLLGGNTIRRGRRRPGRLGRLVRGDPPAPPKPPRLP